MIEVEQMIGKQIRFVMRDGTTIRPAVIVQAWNYLDETGEDPQANGVANLVVFTDGLNDRELSYTEGNIMWATSVEFSREKDPNTYHFPE